MDRLTAVSCLLFSMADVFAIVSIAMPDWLVSHVGGNTRLGLLRNCVTLHNHPDQICRINTAHPSWAFTLVAIFSGCICLSTTIGLLVASHWHREVVNVAKWLGFVAVILFCLASIIFPIGFQIDEIGGVPYQLPDSFQVGLSYIFFVMSLWITVISELFVSKLCLPLFWSCKGLFILLFWLWLYYNKLKYIF